MNNNQMNQAMGVLGGMTGFAVVVNTVDGTSVVAALGDLSTKVGSAQLTTTAENLSGAVNEHDTEIGDVSQLSPSAANLVAAINALAATVAAMPVVAFKTIGSDFQSRTAASATDTINFNGQNGVQTSVSGNSVKIAGANGFGTIHADSGSNKSAATSMAQLNVLGSGLIATEIDASGNLIIKGDTLRTMIQALPQLAFLNIKADDSRQVTATSTADTVKIKGTGGVVTSVVSGEFVVSGATLENSIGAIGQLYGGFTDLVAAVNKLDQRVSALE